MKVAETVSDRAPQQRVLLVVARVSQRGEDFAKLPTAAILDSSPKAGNHEHPTPLRHPIPLRQESEYLCEETSRGQRRACGHSSAL